MMKQGCNIAICVIAYNRPDSLSRCLDSLNKASIEDKTTLIISIDKSDNKQVAEVANKFLWQYGQKEVILHKQNLGLRSHVLSCGDLVEDYDAIVVLEDDIIVSESFYNYACQCVEKYDNDETIAGISLYNYPYNYHTGFPFVPLKTDSDVYMMNLPQSWGQVWTKKQWRAFRAWYDENNEEFGLLPHLPKSICGWPKSSWLKYHVKYCIENRKYFVFPYTSLSTNNGDAGTHDKEYSTRSQVPMLSGIKKTFSLKPQVVYDGFFENESIPDSLGYKSEDVCVDLYGAKDNREHKRYWLTLKELPYKKVNSFALSLRPWEKNVLEKRPGNEIFLYDTEVAEDLHNNKQNIIKLYQYYYDIRGVRALYQLFKHELLQKFGINK